MDSLGATEPIYHKNDAQLTATVNVVATFPFPELDEDLKPLFKTGNPVNAYIVVTDKTVFYAQGGGQPADVGTMKKGDNVFSVRRVRKAPSGVILHVGSFTGDFFNKDDVVDQQVNEKTRKLHSRVHDGGHVVGLAVRSLPAITDISELKAQHFPDSAFVDFKGNIDSKLTAAIEEAANEIVRKDLPITVCFWTLEELKEKCWYVPEGLTLPEGELARAVDIEGAGAYPCGGTHMRTTGEVGAIKIRKISHSKGNSKISYYLKQNRD